MSYFLERLRKYKENRGMMAHMRCILVETKKHRAWPVLHRIGININDEGSAYVAGLFATHPEETSEGNFGATCKAIDLKRTKGSASQSQDTKLTPIERRFQYIIAAQKSEVKQRVLRLVLMAKAEGIPINYEVLARDLYYWNDRTKTQWAAAFWTPVISPEIKEAEA
jgi:CRISPR system Cascade subunit CasB